MDLDEAGSRRYNARMNDSASAYRAVSIGDSTLTLVWDPSPAERDGSVGLGIVAVIDGADWNVGEGWVHPDGTVRSIPDPIGVQRVASMLDIDLRQLEQAIRSTLRTWRPL